MGSAAYPKEVLPLLLLKILRRAAGMCAPAYRLMRLCLLLSCGLLAAAAGILATVDAVNTDTYASWRMAMKLVEMPSAILLIGVIGSVCFEDAFGQDS